MAVWHATTAGTSTIDTVNQTEMRGKKLGKAERAKSQEGQAKNSRSRSLNGNKVSVIVIGDRCWLGVEFAAGDVLMGRRWAQHHHPNGNNAQRPTCAAALSSTTIRLMAPAALP